MLSSAETSVSRPPGRPDLSRRPRRERLVLFLVVVATLTQVYVVSTQDVSRLCLTRNLAAGHVTISPCVGHSLDHARYQGHTYSDKAPGLSILALPVAALAGFPGGHRSEGRPDLGVWLVRLCTSGVAFVMLCFLLGRVAEGIAPGSGAPVIAALALGTITGSLAATMFDQVTAAALCFGAFVLAWRRRPAVAGLLAGTAFLVEYETGPVVAVIVLYVAATGLRRLGRFCLGALPPLLVLGAYDRIAFGSPFHLSYRYVANGFARAQASGFFGISWPRWSAVTTVLVGDRGLLVVSPVVLAAAVGLVLMARRYPREALVCGAVTGVGLLLEFGYFLPDGGVSPGPRFMTVALPFLVLGLAPMFERARRLTSVLLIASVVACTALLVTWPNDSLAGYRGTVWGEIARAVTHSRSRLHSTLTKNILDWAGLSHQGSAIVVAACAAAACVAALSPGRRARRLPAATTVPSTPT
jgi:hypothetical protein